jgi:hypothetical protein
MQRDVGLEPLGLFRFAGFDAAGLAALLRVRFEPYARPGICGSIWLEPTRVQGQVEELPL